MPKQGISVFIRLIETAINRMNVLEQTRHLRSQNATSVGIDHCAMANDLSPEFIPVV